MNTNKLDEERVPAFSTRAASDSVHTLIKQTVVSTFLVSAVSVVGLALGHGIISRHKLKPSKEYRQSRAVIFQCINAWSGGIVISAAFVDLLGETSSELQAKYSYPLAELFCCIGYLISLFIDRSFNSGSYVGVDKEKDDGRSRIKRRHPSHEDNNMPGGTSQVDVEANENSPLISGDNNRNLTEMGNVIATPEHDVCFNLEQNLTESRISALMFIVALSFHSLVEGLAIGSQDESDFLYNILIAVLVHKCIIAFVLGSNVAESTIQHKLRHLLVFVFSSPVGILFGTYLRYVRTDFQRNSRLLLTALPSALASGTFLFISVNGIFPKVLRSGTNYLLCIFFICLGAAMMSALLALEDLKKK